MRVLLLADIHANLVALEAVLLAGRPYDAVWNLGDTVGYGPRPSECLALLRSVGAAPVLAGNHDLAAIGALDVAAFNPVAGAAARWTGGQLSAVDRAEIAAMASTTVESGFTLAHGSPRSPIWEYVLDAETAGANFAQFATDVCFVGHSHVAMVAESDGKSGRVAVRPLADGATMALNGPRRIVNPGSVGQPRDRDARAAFAILDPDAASLVARRVPYDVAATQAQMADAGLPTALIERLAFGM